MLTKDRKQRQMVGDYVTIQGAAQQLGLTYWQAYRAIKRHNVPVIRVGNTLLVRLSDVELAAI